MGKAKTTIEINGKHYDTASGKVIHKANKPGQILTSGTNLDGITRKPKQPHSVPRPTVIASKVHHKATPSHTLMRHAVKKPSHPVSHTDTTTPAVQLNSRYDESRILRAQKVAKNPQISRFGLNNHVKKYSPHLTVKEAPASQVSAVSLPLNASTLVNPFYKALESATAHTQPKFKKASVRARTARKLRVSTKTVNAAAISGAFLILTGFFTFQNIPNLSMRVAAARSGVRANLPGYQPSGFSMQAPIKAESGKVTLAFHSNSDQRQFSLSQRNTSWDNQTLVDNFVALNRRPYQTYQSDDKTIFMYENSNATWIENGVWYQIEGESSLNSDQLLRIASSL